MLCLSLSDWLNWRLSFAGQTEEDCKTDADVDASTQTDDGMQARRACVEDEGAKLSFQAKSWASHLFLPSIT